MLKRLLTALLIFLFYSCPAKAESYMYDYNDNCCKAYQGFLSLHPQQARAAIITEMKRNPYNLMATYIADYEDCLELLLISDPAEYKDRAGHFDARLELLKKGSESSPWYRLCLSGLYLHWALVHTRFGEQYKAAIKFRKSFSLLKENRQLFPAFEYNAVFAGLQEAVVGSLPGSYKWLASIFGMKGNVKKGVGQLGVFAGTHNALQPLYSEAVLYYIYTRFYLLPEQKEAWEMLDNPQFTVGDNLLHAYVKTSIAIDDHKGGAALEALQSAAKNADYDRYPVFDYLEGVALFNRLDTACIGCFMHYLEKNRSGLLVKDCWQKIALCRYMNNDMARAGYCRILAGTSGNTRMDADKQAEKFAESRDWPPMKLLQARLLIEGGDCQKALALLGEINSGRLAPADKAEYLYRSGRAYEQGGDDQRALDFYRSAVSAGRNRQEQFAARAALQMGLIYERCGMKTEAAGRFRESLSMPAHDFQNAIDQQAKAGINRLSETEN